MTLLARNPPVLNSLGLYKSAAETRVVVAMSGGVDSSVVAAMLAEEGYDVVGVTLQLYDHGAALAQKGACCAGRDIHDARRVAETHGLSALRVRLREPLPRERDRRIRRRLPRRRDAGALHPLQRARQVPRPARDRARPRRRLHGDRALRPPPRRAGRGRAAPRGRSGARPELFPLRDDARAARLPALPARRARLQGRDPGAGGALRAAASPTSPTARTSASCPNGSYAAVIEKLRPGAAEPGDIVACRRPRARAPRRRHPLHGRPAPRARDRRRRAALRRPSRRRGAGG